MNIIYIPFFYPIYLQCKKGKKIKKNRGKCVKKKENSTKENKVNFLEHKYYFIDSHKKKRVDVLIIECKYTSPLKLNKTFSFSDPLYGLNLNLITRNNRITRLYPKLIFFLPSKLIIL